MGLKPIPLSPNKFSKIQARPAGSTQINKAHVWFHQHRWCTCERRADQRPDMLFMWGTHFLSSSAVCLTKSLCTDSTFRSGDHNTCPDNIGTLQMIQRKNIFFIFTMQYLFATFTGLDGLGHRRIKGRQ